MKCNVFEIILKLGELRYFWQWLNHFFVLFSEMYFTKVQRVDRAILRLNYYPAERLCHLLDSDLSSGWCYLLFG